MLWCSKGLTIALTLHHFVHPLWFDDMGGFTRAENIPHFTNFASIAFRSALPGPGCWTNPFLRFHACPVIIWLLQQQLVLCRVAGEEITQVLCGM